MRIKMTWRCPRRILPIAVLTIVAACTGDLPNPPGQAPTLAGTWGSPTSLSDSGCWVIDESGDLVAIRGPGSELTPFGESGLVLDGKWRPIDFEQLGGQAPEGVVVEFAGVGEATLSGSNVRIEFSLSMRAFGIILGTGTSTIEGTFDGTRIVGTLRFTGTSNIPGAPPPPDPEPKTIEFVRRDC